LIRFHGYEIQFCNNRSKGEKNMKIKLMIKQLMLAMALLTANSLSAAAVQAAEFKGVVGIGVDVGGDTLATAVYTDGTTADVKANNGLVFNGGAVMIVDSYETQATVGYKFGGPIGKNGTVTWDTVPLELIQFLRASNVRIGLGLIYHINPRLTVDIPGASYTINYDNAFGTVAQIGWAPLNMPFSIDLRYTAIKYRQSNINNAQEASGAAFGIYSSYYF
jgi:hypothetical protein